MTRKAVYAWFSSSESSINDKWSGCGAHVYHFCAKYGFHLPKVTIVPGEAKEFGIFQ